MDKFVKLIEQLMPLVVHYPTWSKVLFTATLFFILFSVLVFVVLYPTASKRKASSEISLSVSLLDDENAKASGTVLENECERVLELKNTVGYFATRHKIIYSDKTMTIEPDALYLSKLSVGGPIGPLLEPYESEIVWCPPNLDFRIGNNSDRTIVLNNLLFEIEESKIDPAPLLIVEADELRWNALHTRLVNEGWNKIQDCTMDFNIMPVDHSDWRHAWEMMEKLSFQRPYRHSINIGSFEHETNVDISPAFAQEGVGSTVIQKAIRGPAAEVTTYKPTAKELRKFSSGSSLVYGELNFKSLTINEMLKQYSVKFTAIVHLSNKCLGGAALPSSFQYKVQFNVDQKNYKVPLAIAQSLKSRESDRFNVRVVAPKSSFHKFKVRLLYDNGDSMISGPIEMRILVPKSVSRRLRL
jgi:hypothetical protein